MPPAAKWLGAFGALPFVVLAIASAVLEGPLDARASFALAAYGAVILSFLGGIHWGLAIAGPGESMDAMPRRLAWSVIPSLIGWAALLVPGTAGLLVLAAAFALMLMFDARASRNAEAPPWYPNLRRPLTAVVVTALALGAIA